MDFKSRFYKRKEPTKDRLDEQHALIESNLVGLSLSDDLEMAKVFEYAKNYERGREDRPAPKVEVQALSDEESAAFIRAIEQDSKPIGERTAEIAAPDIVMPPPPPKVYRRNFVMVAPVIATGNKTFIHGRDLFSEKNAAEYFADGTDKDTFAYDKFSDTAKQKVRNVLGREGLQARMYSYLLTEDPVVNFKNNIEEVKLDYPHFKTPALPEVTKENLLSCVMTLLQAMEAQGVDPEEMMQNHLFPEGKHLDRLHKQLKDAALAELDAMKKGEHGSTVRNYESGLMDRLAKHDYDPEILHAFAAGIKHVGQYHKQGQRAKLDDLIAAGMEEKVERLLREAAKTMANPYDAKFVDAEKHVTDTLVHSVHPRVLRNTRRQNTAMLITDDDSLSPFSNILGIDGGYAAGKYTPKMPARSQHSNDTVMVSAPMLNYQRLAMFARHEFEHHRDFSGGQSFAGAYKGVLHECLEDDSKTLADTYEFLLKFSSKDATQRDIGRFNDLADKRGLPSGEKAATREETLRIREKTYGQLLNEVRTVDHWVRNTFMPHEGMQSIDTSYRLKLSQMTEVPAVIEQVRGMVGTDLAKALLPRMHEAVMYHRLQDSNLRDKPATR